jgi:hypothetical protein
MYSRAAKNTSAANKASKPAMRNQRQRMMSAIGTPIATQNSGSMMNTISPYSQRPSNGYHGCTPYELVKSISKCSARPMPTLSASPSRAGRLARSSERADGQHSHSSAASSKACGTAHSTVCVCPR